MKKSRLFSKIVYIVFGVMFIAAGFLFYTKFGQIRAAYPKLQLQQSMAVIPIFIGIVMIVMPFVKLMKAAREAKNRDTLSGAHPEAI
jgi:TRAP-type C4-dicarboxylate transport system permease small subunit